MLFLQNCDGLNVSDKSFKVLKFDNYRITLAEELWFYALQCEVCKYAWFNREHITTSEKVEWPAAGKSDIEKYIGQSRIVIP